ncbi:MAG: FtsW/RodA/SpoVE family cell cycle protein [Victivallales bacterium]|nr:FtsW/RodA/SpoVE family cell cycle protein [Victivallales bacterium]
MLYTADIKQNALKLLRMDKLALLVQGLLLLAGVLYIRQAGMDYGSAIPGRWKVQMMWIVFGAVAYLALALADYRAMGRWSPLAFLGGILLLGVVLLAGAYLNGARSVLRIGGGISLQVSEVMKPVTLLFVSWLLSHPLLRYTAIPSELLWAGAISLPVLLVALEPDWGTALVFVPFSFAILFLNRISWRGLLVLAFVAACSAPLLYHALKPYQKVRIFVFAREPLDAITAQVQKVSPEQALRFKTWLDNLQGELDNERILALEREEARKQEKLQKNAPATDQVIVAPVQQGKKASAAELLQAKKDWDDWNARQALYSVGSGRLHGRGLGQGTQHKLGFLPRAVAPTDFIFSVIGEESGFIGGASILTGLLLVMLLSCRTAFRAADSFGASIAGGAAVLWATHVFINVGMCMNWAPIIGIPLPFVSYGGSFMLGTMAVAGLVQSVHIHTPPRRRKDEEDDNKLEGSDGT